MTYESIFIKKPLTNGHQTNSDQIFTEHILFLHELKIAALNRAAVVGVLDEAVDPLVVQDLFRAVHCERGWAEVGLTGLQLNTG